MSLLSALSVSMSGMNAAAKRLEVSSSNVANAETVGAVPTPKTPSTVYKALTVQQSAIENGGVSTSVVQKSPAYEVRYQPGSSFANAQGLVAAPNVDFASEAVDQLTARISYEASAKVMATANDMMKSTSDILS